MHITLYKRIKVGGKCWYYSVLPAGFGNASEQVIESEDFLLPEGYEVQKSVFGCGTSTITKDGKLKPIYTDMDKKLPYVVEYEQGMLPFLTSAPTAKKIYLKKQEKEL
jgi:hypothetical protein